MNRSKRLFAGLLILLGSAITLTACANATTGSQVTDNKQTENVVTEDNTQKPNDSANASSGDGDAQGSYITYDVLGNSNNGNSSGDLAGEGMSINEILTKDPLEQIKLLVETSIVPENEANASERLSNRICERIQIEEVSRNSSGIVVRIIYPNVADAFLEVYNAASDDTLAKDIYSEVERRLRNGECPMVSDEFSIGYSADGVALDFGEDVANALTGGLYSVELN
ncbi:MAG: hypothetical protein KBS85_07405 [Lachnospiraceae bacterium]|nr:hypothetical protein [Candidatus Merdinaster equi]